MAVFDNLFQSIHSRSFVKEVKRERETICGQTGLFPGGNENEGRSSTRVAEDRIIERSVHRSHARTEAEGRTRE